VYSSPPIYAASLAGTAAANPGANGEAHMNRRIMQNYHLLAESL
jgi:hypothetical protein